MDLAATARCSLESVDAYVLNRSYAGPDPYDALASSLGRSLRGRIARQVTVQTVKRLPFNVRSLIGVPRVRMMKALALFCSGLHRAPYLPDAHRRGDDLVFELSRSAQRGAWGYEFDVQTRWAFYPAGTPNIIVTAFVVEALAERGRSKDLDGTREWLDREMIHPKGFIRYLPGSDALIHNANVLGARTLYRLDPGHPAIEPALDMTIRAQRSDGLWHYGEATKLSWVDTFHTAYVLLGMDVLRDRHPRASECLHSGTLAWLHRCFDRHKRPRYFADRNGSVDIHNLATTLYALITLSSRVPECESYVEPVTRELLRHQRPDGAFVASRRQPAFMRWNQGHSHLALAELSRWLEAREQVRLVCQSPESEGVADGAA